MWFVEQGKVVHQPSHFVQTQRQRGGIDGAGRFHAVQVTQQGAAHALQPGLFEALQSLFSLPQGRQQGLGAAHQG